MKVAAPLEKNILAPLGTTIAASAIDAATLIISNEEINEIMNIAQTLEDSNILLKGVTKIVKNETKEQKGGFLSMLLGTLGASLLGDMLTEKGIVRAGYGNKKGEGMLRTGYGNKWIFNTASSFNKFSNKKVLSK